MLQQRSTNKIPVFTVLSIVLLMAGIATVAIAEDRPKISSVVFRDQEQDTNQVQSTQRVESSTNRIVLNSQERDSRYSTALIYSCVMPGSGQTMLGHTYKGVAFTLTAFSSVLTAVISHNNFVARGERLDALEYQYANSTNWVSANYLYSEMQSAHTQLKRDRNKRNLFLMISAAVWTLNIVDVMYNTEDQGQPLFSVTRSTDVLLAGQVESPHRPLVSLSLPLE